MKKQKIILITAGVLLGIFVLKNLSSSNDPDWDMKSAKVKKSKYINYTEITGQLKPASEHYVTVNSEGQLDTLFVSANQQVKQGEILGIVNENINKAQLESALSEFNLASKEYNRVKRLRRMSTVSQVDLDNAKNIFLMKKSALKKSKQNFENAIARSPIDGYISQLAFKKNDNIPRGSRIAVIEDRSKFEINFRLRREKINKIEFDKEIVVLSKSYDIFNRKKDNNIYEKVSVTITNLSKDQRYQASYIDCKATLYKIPSFSKPGDTIALEIAPKEKLRSFKIPKKFILAEKDKNFVLTESKKGKKLTEIKILRSLENDSIVATNEDLVKVYRASPDIPKTDVIRYFRSAAASERL